MSSYEFWDELGKIFNAVVAYQEKNIEFNKRFINPWIRLGNVFDKQDRNQEAIGAYKKAIEIDPDNAQNWFELGNVHFKMESHARAVEAFNQAIALDPGFGWSYSNLALTLVAQGKYEEAIPLYCKSIDLLQEDKDKAVAWNRLGNVYRKLDKYELAEEAFHKADELDKDNAGFRDDLDEVAEGPILVQSGMDGNTESASALKIRPIELIVADSQAEEAAAQAMEAAGISQEPAAAAPAPPIETASQEPAVFPEAAEVTSVAAEVQSAPIADASSADLAEKKSEAVEFHDEPATSAPTATQASQPSEEVSLTADYATGPSESASSGEHVTPPSDPTALGQETVTVVVHDTIETFTETLPAAHSPEGTPDAVPTADLPAETNDESAPDKVEVVVAENAAASNEPATETTPVEKTVVGSPRAIAETTEAVLGKTQPVAAVKVAQEAVVADKPADSNVTNEQPVEPVLSDVTEFASAQEPGPVQLPEQVAYEEFLKDTNEPIHIFDSDTNAEGDVSVSQEPVAKIDPSGELQIEMDTKNAHVWNELGNVYFNTSAYDDAIVAYSKAIELDRWFAWPYSNLALTYVQKRRFVEAILLYQRSIELFATEKDKAISWNRLGNVYRRLNDYENAIAAYQRADDLDPDNTTLSLQSRFSLLGSYAVDQKPSYVS
jgi:tetratricopeptide (TPR) repeat protein